jgi:hypothetical protein
VRSDLPVAHPLLLAAGVAGLIVGFVLFLVCLLRWLGRRRRAFVARVPLLGRHEVELPSPGAYVIDMEYSVLQWTKPLWMTVGPGLLLREAAADTEVPLRPTLLDIRSRPSFSQERKQLKSFSVARAGRYVLTGTAGDSSREWHEHALVVARAGGWTSALLMVGIVTGSVLASAGLIGAIAGLLP